MSNWVCTISGREFNPFHPRVENIEIGDIAGGLAKCRFGKQIREFYTVAQHSFEMANQAMKMGLRDIARWCLLHDAAEAYLFDVQRPIKVGLGWMIDGGFLPFENLERRILHVVAAKYDLPLPIPPLVGIIDDRQLASERRDLFDKNQPEWLELTADPFEDTVYPCSPAYAEQFFLQTFQMLFGAK